MALRKLSFRGPKWASTGSAYATKQEYAAAVLRDAIVTGTMKPGQRLRQHELAHQLNLSWTPIREALRQLETEGWLIIEQHRGAVVAPLTIDDFEDLYIVRLALEPLAARLGAERANDETLLTMARIRDDMQRLARRSPPGGHAFLELEREYRAVHYRCAAQPRLYDLVMSHRIAAERYLRVSFTLGNELNWHLRGQAAIFEACRRRDGHQAELIMRRALERVRDRMRPLLAGKLPPSNPRSASEGHLTVADARGTQDLPS